jgi:hypothetical protein
MVESEYKEPTVEPVLLSLVSFNFTENGETIPRRKAGKANKMLVAIIVAGNKLNLLEMNNKRD